MYALRRGMGELRRRAQFVRHCAIGRVRAHTQGVRFAWRRWVRGGQVWSNQRLHANMQAAECVRLALRWWAHLTDEARIHDLAMRVGLQRAVSSACLAALDRWRSWQALEEVFVSRWVYRETELMQEMLGRWQAAAAR